MKRGAVVLARERGSPAGKSRPCVVVQSTVTIDFAVKLLCVPLSTTLRGIPAHRPTIVPSSENGLRETCEAQVDWLYPFLRENIGAVIGTLDDESMARIEIAMRLWLDL